MDHATINYLYGTGTGSRSYDSPTTHHTPHKRKAHQIYNEYDEEEEEYHSSKKQKEVPEEKRLRRHRAKVPQSFYVIYERATSQRFYVLNRTRIGTAECPEEHVELTGSTGNIYDVHIAKQPACTCPHALGGNQCKHVVYVMSRVLRARFELVYQLALLSTELVEIFAGAPPIPGTASGGDEKDKDKDKDKNRKTLEGDCPICFSAFSTGEATVYCRATCGQNLHKECFDMWAATKRKSGSGKVTCPMCRTNWQDEDDGDVGKRIKNMGVAGLDGLDGYVNVADQVGVSRIRDHSTYHTWDGRYRYHDYW